MVHVTAFPAGRPCVIVDRQRCQRACAATHMQMMWAAQSAMKMCVAELSLAALPNWPGALWSDCLLSARII